MTENEIKKQITQFLGQHIRSAELHDDTDIFASGFVNSLFAMQLVMFIEKEFSITIENEDLELDNFRTVSAMSRLITSKQ